MRSSPSSKWMQSTGQTSTQAWSWTSMQGLVMVYVMLFLFLRRGRSERAVRGIWDTTTRFRQCEATEPEPPRHARPSPRADGGPAPQVDRVEAAGLQLRD